jgi:hypothetical protein
MAAFSFPPEPIALPAADSCRNAIDIAEARGRGELSTWPINNRLN